MMELTELSLGPASFPAVEKSSNSSSSESEGNSSRKRKIFSDHLLNNDHQNQTSVDLHAKDPLPVDWEQCLDLESGRMYYLNRKTLRKSWNWPKHQKLDLELNMSTTALSSFPDQCSSSNSLEDQYSNHKNNSPSSSNMVALACLRCHLLVILSKSSPSCPNCKYVHSLPTLQTPQSRISPAKSLHTLSLLN